MPAAIEQGRGQLVAPARLRRPPQRPARAAPEPESGPGRVAAGLPGAGDAAAPEPHLHGRGPLRQPDLHLVAGRHRRSQRHPLLQAGGPRLHHAERLLQAQASDSRALVLRANAGDCITVKLYNYVTTAQLPAGASAPNLPAPAQTNPPTFGLTCGTNCLPSNTSSYVGLHPQLPTFDASTSDGFNVGATRPRRRWPTAALPRPNTWYAGNVDVRNPANPYIPIELGASNLLAVGRRQPLSARPLRRAGDRARGCDRLAGLGWRGSPRQDRFPCPPSTSSCSPRRTAWRTRRLPPARSRRRSQRRQLPDDDSELQRHRLHNGRRRLMHPVQLRPVLLDALVKRCLPQRQVRGVQPGPRSDSHCLRRRAGSLPPAASGRCHHQRGLRALRPRLDRDALRERRSRLRAADHADQPLCLVDRVESARLHGGEAAGGSPSRQGASRLDHHQVVPRLLRSAEGFAQHLAGVAQRPRSRQPLRRPHREDAGGSNAVTGDYLFRTYSADQFLLGLWASSGSRAAGSRRPIRRLLRLPSTSAAEGGSR